MKAPKRYKLFQDTSKELAQRRLHFTKRLFLLPALILLVGLSGLNLNWIILSQKILHQWKLKNQLTSEAQVTFQFSEEEWSNKIELHGSEFQFDGKWYDITAMNKTGNTIIITAHQDKWEYVYQNILKSKSPNEQKTISIASIELWKYVPSANQLIPAISNLENRKNCSDRYLDQVPSDFHADLLRPPAI